MVDILFWTPRGQLLRNKCIITVTNIAELVEYVLLAHNDDMTKPCVLNAKFCTPLQPFFAYQLCPSVELKPV